MPSRRTTLSGIGASVTAAISGCLSLGSDNDEYPANVDNNDTDESRFGPDPRIANTRSPQPEVVDQDISGTDVDDELMFYPEAVVRNTGTPGKVIVLVVDESFSRLPDITRDADSIIRAQQLRLDPGEERSVSYDISEVEGNPESLFVLPLTIDVIVQNRGQSGSILVSLTAESIDPLTKKISVSAGGSTTATFNRDPISPQIDWAARVEPLTTGSSG